MKRLISLALVLCLMLSGCGTSGERIMEPVTFYYLQSKYSYGSEGAVIASEEREASGHRRDLNYLLALYLMGPSSEALISPVPQGTRILSVEQEGTTIQLSLSDAAGTLTDAEFSLACACLTLTCLDLTEVEAVTVTCGSRSVTMSHENLTLFDSSMAAATEETQ